MFANPVFHKELRQSLLRRKPLHALALWCMVAFGLLWITPHLPDWNYPIAWIPALLLPMIVPAFAAGTFASEYEQQTWQDLTLTRLTNFEIVTGKFFAALLQAWLLVVSFLPAMILLLLLQFPLLRQDLMFGLAIMLEWTVQTTLQLLITTSFYVLLVMVCSRYSPNRRTAMLWSYMGLSLYAIGGFLLWQSTGRYQDYYSRMAYTSNFNPGSLSGVSIPPQIQIQDLYYSLFTSGFMQTMHLLLSSVIGIGSAVLLWVSLSEQRGYRRDAEHAPVLRVHWKKNEG